MCFKKGLPGLSGRSYLGFVHPRAHKIPSHSRIIVDKIQGYFQEFFVMRYEISLVNCLPHGPYYVIFNLQNLSITEIQRSECLCSPSHTRTIATKNQALRKIGETVIFKCGTGEIPGFSRILLWEGQI